MFGRFETEFHRASAYTLDAWCDWADENGKDSSDEAEFIIWLGNEEHDNG